MNFDIKFLLIYWETVHFTALRNASQIIVKANFFMRIKEKISFLALFPKQFCHLVIKAG